jgi:hypothetical protein
MLPLLLILVAVTITLKGYALWYAARAEQLYWFIALLVVNTAGILEIVYLLFFRPDAPYKQTVKSATTDTSSVPPSSPTV